MGRRGHADHHKLRDLDNCSCEDCRTREPLDVKLDEQTEAHEQREIIPFMLEAEHTKGVPSCVTRSYAGHPVAGYNGVV